MARTLNSNLKNSNDAKSIKFLYSYGGRILPRRSDGKLRYVGGHTRVLAVDRSITFAELMVRFVELWGPSMCLKCKLPSEDLDVLVSITCDEDLTNVVEEYDRYSLSNQTDLKIRAVLFPAQSGKKVSPPPSSAASSADCSATTSPPATPPCVAATSCYSPTVLRYGGSRTSPRVFGYPAQRVRCYPNWERGSPRIQYPVHHCNRL